MTRSHPLTLAAMLCAATLAFAAPAAAQDGPPPGGMRGRGHGHMMANRRTPPSVDERVQRMSGELNLTADQTAKVKALLVADQRTADSIRAVRALQFETERKAMDARREAHQKALLAILTPEQKAKHEALQQQHRGPGRRGPGAPPAGRPGDRRGPGESDGAQR